MRKPAVRWSMVLAAAVIGALTASLIAPAGATHQPANKVVAAGSTMEVMTAPLVDGAASEEAVLLSGTMRTSSPTDLLIEVNAECALFTDTIIRTPAGAGESDSSEAIAKIEVWVEIDGTPVPVTEGDNGRVVFCNRAQFNQVTIGPDDDDEDDHEFRQYLDTRAANSFSWIWLNVGSGIHEIVVKSSLTANVTGTGNAKAIVGKRTMVVDADMMANDATI
ncbi:MAG TPA: hypothetical protein VGB52_10105 [Actinomycetota bacterium]